MCVKGNLESKGIKNLSILIFNNYIWIISNSNRNKKVNFGVCAGVITLVVGAALIHIHEWLADNGLLVKCVLEMERWEVDIVNNL